MLVPLAVEAGGAPSKKPGGFASPNLGPGQAWDLVLPAPGTYAYHCTPHPGMRGTIMVASNATAANAAVEIKGYRFQPATTWLAPNGTIAFTNRDVVVHTATETAPESGNGNGSPASGVALTAVAAALGLALVRRRQ
ncbi:MAG: hypothetical protein HYT80_02750 [Euryarchaeota archaeon]|nr:hypothetical protein [Euryarchaeota archaeon]